MKKIDNVNKHLRRYLLIAKFLFTLVFIAHTTAAITTGTVNFLGIEITQTISILFAFVTGSMAFMASYYYRMLSGECGEECQKIFKDK